jgi:hypothetical protein
LELLSCELLANPAAVADVLDFLVQNVHKTLSEAFHARKAWVKNSAVSMGGVGSDDSKSTWSSLFTLVLWFVTRRFHAEHDLIAEDYK